MPRTAAAGFLFSGILIVTAMAAAELQNVAVSGYHNAKKEDRFSEVVEAYSDDAGGTRIIILDNITAPSWSRIIAVPDHPGRGRVRSLFNFYTRANGASPAGPVAVTVLGGDFPPFRCVLTDSDWRPWMMDVSCAEGGELEVRVTATFPKGGPCRVLLGLPRLVSCYGPHYDGLGGLTRRSMRQIGWYAPFVSGEPSVPLMPMVQNVPPPNYEDIRRFSAERLPDLPLILVRFNVIEPATVHLISPPYETVAPLVEGYFWLPVPAQIDDEKYGYARWAEGGLVEQGPVDIVPNFMIDDQPILDALSRQFRD